MAREEAAVANDQAEDEGGRVGRLSRARMRCLEREVAVDTLLRESYSCKRFHPGHPVAVLRTLLRAPSTGLLVVLLLLGAALAAAAGSHIDPVTGKGVNNFLNAHTLIQMATDASAF